MTNDRNGNPLAIDTDYVVIGPLKKDLGDGRALLNIGRQPTVVEAAEIARIDDVGGGGVTDHGALTGLADDDHTQYHTDARGDARYSALGHGHAASAITNTPAGGIAATDVQAAINELDTEKAAASHTHAAADITSGTIDVARLPAASTSAAGIAELATSAETTAGLVVQASDTRLSDARTPSAHATSHQNGGGDEIAVAAAAANAIPKAGAGGTLAKEWLPAATTSNQGAVVVGTSAGTSVPRMSDHVDLVDITSAGAPMKFTSAGDIPTHGQAASLLTGTILAAQMPAHTGDVTSSAGSVALTIANDAVTYAKMQNVSATDKVLGRSTAGAGDVEEIACTAAGRALIDDADAAAQRTTLGLGTAALRNMGVGSTDLIDLGTMTSTFVVNSLATDSLVGRDTAGTGTVETISVSGGLEFTGSGGIQRSALTGDVTASAGSNATTIAANAVSDTKLRDSAALSVIGRSANSTGDPADIAAGTSGHVLRRSGTTLGFGALSIHGMRLPPAFFTANNTSSTTVATNTTRAIYIGRVSEPLSSVVVIYSVTVAAATITWAEVAIATGAFVAVGSPALTTVGYSSVSAVVNTTGIKSTTVTITGTLSVGDNLWVLIGNQATTALQLRAGSIVDDLWSGALATATARPSTMAAATTFTGGNENCAWIMAGSL